eukprot:CAMPEP_0172840134 /NCGR_PEP_ID=MMETSP1075-20121228/29080_1 /TAXON_ID=2916 /ORGANISM="Ceratium fusus, Strain PA161109" /LENGTH=96 /DNA_ID=CAMNT_0013683899 /DNA_START=166 /DNA_END=454 /DNA_ORIENTATION=-
MLPALVARPHGEVAAEPEASKDFTNVANEATAMEAAEAASSACDAAAATAAIDVAMVETDEEAAENRAIVTKTASGTMYEFEQDETVTAAAAAAAA